MRVFLVVCAVAAILIVLWDAFEVIVLPRRVARRLRLARLMYRFTWPAWSGVARLIRERGARESFLGIYGPLSLIFLVAMWAVGLVCGFGILHWALDSAMRTPGEPATFATYLYLSGTTFFTLGLGDVTPVHTTGRVLIVTESGIGFGFLALVIGYLPVLYNSFSRREVAITLLDPRAGSPPTAGELLRRHRRDHFHHLEAFLREWERAIAEMMESHLSYPVLVYFRSQHANQSWLAAVTTILDTCALLIAVDPDRSEWQPRATFAMARHAVIDLARVLYLDPRPPAADRVAASDLERLFHLLEAAGRPACDRQEAERRLVDLRRSYEPYVGALGARLLIPLPAWTGVADTPDEH